MIKTLLIALTSLTLLAFTAPAKAQSWNGGDWPNAVPNISGTWYMNGDEDNPCQIIQRRQDGGALFINEHGSRAGGTVRGDRVWIPDWTSGQDGDPLMGRLRGDKIIWPNGTFWSRWSR